VTHPWPPDAIHVEGCPLCGHAERRQVLEHLDQSFVCILQRCLRCTFTYLDPFPSTRQIIAWQDLDPGSGDLAADTPGLTGILRDIERFVPGGRMLEVGCNAGNLLVVAARRGWSVAGVEISGNAARRAQAQLGGRVWHGPLEDSPFKHHLFDCVVMWHVLEHVPSPLALLETARNRLRPGGLLAVQVPSLTGLDQLRDAGRIAELVCPVHLSYFDLTTLQRSIADSGLSVEFANENEHHHLTVYARKHAPD